MLTRARSSNAKGGVMAAAILLVPVQFTEFYPVPGCDVQPANRARCENRHVLTDPKEGEAVGVSTTPRSM